MQITPSVTITNTTIDTSPRPIRSDIHVVPSGKLWAVKNESSQAYSGYFQTQLEARAYGMNLAREGAVSLVLHGQDGKIRSVTSYDK